MSRLSVCFALFILVTSCSKKTNSPNKTENASQNESARVVEYVKQHLLANASFTGDESPFAKIDSLVSADRLDSTVSFRESFDYIVHFNWYALLHDFDGDTKDELVFLQVEGSAGNPYLHICKLDSLSRKFRSITHIDGKLLWPLSYQKHLYFLEKNIDPNSDSVFSLNIYDINSRLDTVQKASFNVGFTHSIADSLY